MIHSIFYTTLLLILWYTKLKWARLLLPEAFIGRPATVGTLVSPKGPCTQIGRLGLKYILFGYMDPSGNGKTTSRGQERPAQVAPGKAPTHMIAQKGEFQKQASRFRVLGRRVPIRSRKSKDPQQKDPPKRSPPNWIRENPRLAAGKRWTEQA